MASTTTTTSNERSPWNYILSDFGVAFILVFSIISLFYGTIVNLTLCLLKPSTWVTVPTTLLVSLLDTVQAVFTAQLPVFHKSIEPFALMLSWGTVIIPSIPGFGDYWLLLALFD